MFDMSPFSVSLRLAACTTIILLAVCLPLVRLRLSSRSAWIYFMESFAVLPMVLPPTVIGFYFLSAFSPSAAPGMFIERFFGFSPLFSFPALVLASVFSCFPFMYQNLKTAMLGIDSGLIEVSYTLGKGRVRTFFGVMVPIMIPGILSGSILTFAHALGEFGLALMVGGSIAGKTKTVSIAIFESVESYDYGRAHTYSLIVFAAAWLLSGILQFAQNRGRRVLP